MNDDISEDEISDSESIGNFCCKECKLRFQKQKKAAKKKEKRKRKKKPVQLPKDEYDEIIDEYADKLNIFLQDSKDEISFWKSEYQKFKDIDHIQATTKDLFAIFYIGQSIAKLKQSK
jgi:hypothetical protein